MECLHKNNIGVILAWNAYMESVEFDFNNVQTRNYLLANAYFWIEEYHIDGLIINQVIRMLYLDYGNKADWQPNIYGGKENLAAIDFLKYLNSILQRDFPGIVKIAGDTGL